MMQHTGTLRLNFVDGLLSHPGFMETDGCYCLCVPENQSLLLVEEHGGNPIHHELNMEIVLEKNASLHLLKYQNLQSSAHLHATLKIIQQEGSHLQAGFFSKGALEESQTLTLHQTGTGATSLLYGFSGPTQDRQCLRHEMDIHHLAPYGQSRMLFRGILDGQSKTFLRGRVNVSPDGKHATVSQGSHYLLLSDRAEASTLPELEISQDEIKCSHGATIGQLDEEALFYLCSRGIGPDHAEKMLRQAFVADVFENIPSPLKPWLFQQMGYDHESPV